MSPIFRSPSVAVLRSIATSSSVCGAVTRTLLNGFDLLAGRNHPTPIVGPAVLDRVAVLLSTRARRPGRRLAPRHARRPARPRPADFGDRRPVRPAAAAGTGVGLERLPARTTGVDALVDVRRRASRSVCPSVSVSTNVPAMNATPSMTASDGQHEAELVGQQALERDPQHDALRLRAASCGRGRASAVGSRDLVDDLAVGEEHDAVGVAGGDRVVRDHHDRLAEVAAPRCA